MGLQMFIDANVTAEDIATAGEFDFPDLTDAQAADLAKIFLDRECVDMGQVMADMMKEQSSGALTEAQASCIFDKMAKSDAFAKAFASGLAGEEDPESSAAMEYEILEFLGDCEIPLDAFG